MRRVTASEKPFTWERVISIHTLRVEGDHIMEYIGALPLRISIHTLRVEGDPLVQIEFQKGILFLSTPSVWRVTLIGLFVQDHCVISIHTLRVEGDPVTLAVYLTAEISIHTLRVEGDGSPIISHCGMY